MKYKIVFSVLLFVSCKVDETDLQNAGLKIYEKSSTDFGDIISFNQMKVRNDTIFLENEPIYQILAYKKRYFMDEFITIKSIKTQNSATFIKK